MALDSPRRKKVFFSYKEATAGTPDTNCFIEGRGMMSLPEAEYQFESDKNKLGSGEAGTKQEIQAAWTPWSYKCMRLSEVAFFLSYFQGRSYAVSSSGDLERHELFHLTTQEMTMPTFTIEYGNGGTGGNTVISGCVVNEMSITLASGGNGVIDATFSGFGSRHQYTGNAIAVHSAGNMDSSDAAFTISTEPYINFKACSIWLADAVNSNLKNNSVLFSGENLGANLIDISTLVNSITITGNNGMSADEMPRASGGGVPNVFVRSTREYGVELNIRKDDSSVNTDTIILADTQKALEVQFSGKYISGTDPHGLDIVFPVVQMNSGAEDDSNPINKTIPLVVFEDSDNSACEIFVQSEVSSPYNGSL